MASRNIGSLTIDLIAKTAGFEQGMDRAARIADRRSRDISRAINSGLKGALGGVTAFVTGLVGGIVSAQQAFQGFINAVNNADRLDELSSRLGISTEQLSAWGYAAKLSGTDLESLTGSIQKFSKTVASAADANSRQGELFAALGINVKDAAGNLRDVEQLLPEVADRFKQLNNDTTEAALAQELFGRSGAELLEFLNRGSDGLRELGDEAKNLGGIIDGDTAKAAAAFNDELDKLRISTNGYFTSIAREVLPALTDLIREFRVATTQGEALGRTATLIKGAFDALTSAFDFFSKTTRVNQALFNTYNNTLASVYNTMRGIASLDFSRAGTGIRSLINGLRAGFNQATGDVPLPAAGRARNARGGSNRPETGGGAALLGNVNSFLADPGGSSADKAARDAARRAKELEREAEKIAKAIRKMADAQRDWTTELQDTGNPILDDYQRKLDEIRTSAEEYKSLKVPAEQISSFTSEMERLALAIKNKELAEFQRDFSLDTESAANSLIGASNASIVYQKSLFDLDKQLKQGLITQQLYDERLKVISENRHAEATQLIRDMQFEISLLSMTNIERQKAIALRGMDSESISKYGGSISGLVVELDQAQKTAALWDGVQSNLSDSLFDLATGAKSAKDAVLDFFDQLSRQLLRALSENWAQQIADLLKGGQQNAASGGGGFWGTLVNGFVSAFGGARANGGPVMANTPYLVGERGPELFMPNSSGTVLSNQQTRGMGGTLVQNFYNPRLMDMTTDYQRAQQEGRKASRALSRGG
jgi:hypothetical protein